MDTSTRPRGPQPERQLGATRAALALMCLFFATACVESRAATKQAVRAAAARRVAARLASGVLRVTAIPDENPDALQRKNALLSAYLSDRLGLEVEFLPVADYGAAVQALISGQVDFAWLGGFTYVQAKRQAGAVAVVMRASDQHFKSAFIAHEDSGIDAMKDLRGKRFAFGSKSSTSGRLMPQHFLSEKFQLDAKVDFAERPVFSGAHDATVLMVSSRMVDAGALNFKTWERLSKANDQVRLIWTTPPYVDYTWAASPAVPAALRGRFASAFMAMNQAEHAALLELQSAERYVAAKPGLWEAIERVGLSSGLLKPER